MVFLGWTLHGACNPTGLASLTLCGDELVLDALETRTGISSIHTWIEDRAGSGPALLAVDAPLVIANATGMREADRLTHTLYGAKHAGCYPANLSLAFAPRTTGFSNALLSRGFTHGIAIQPRSPCRMQIEVFPHIGAVELFGLARIVKYKRGRVAERVRALAEYRALLLKHLPALHPPVRPFDLPPVPEGGRALKQLEDELDALLCAYLAAYWWHWGTERNSVLGDAQNGYIVVPRP